ncbi:MAG: putative Fe-S cluster assembly protein SufT [Candidatus Binatia bacterium]|jgi:probable FeS assembly SUF system protein SufT
MVRYQEVVTTRDCEVVQIPSGYTVLIPAGASVVITQALGDSFTIEVPTLGGLYRVAGADADAISKERPVSADEAAGAGPVSEARIWSALRNVYDPEIPVNIVELGLVYDLRIEPLPAGGSRVHVEMTLTAPGCGMWQIIADEAKRLIEAVPGVTEADVLVVFDPPWNQQMMSEAAKLQLGCD